MEGRKEIQFWKRALFGIIDDGQSQERFFSSHLSLQGGSRINRIILNIVTLSPETFKLRLCYFKCSSYSPLLRAAPFSDCFRLEGIADFVERGILL